MDIALVKTSSLGDVIHALPVASDILAAHPQARIDWVVEEAFAELPALHPGIARIHQVAVRRWRRAPWSRATREEWRRFRDGLRAMRYDLVLDLQGLIKSAFIARQALGPRAGFDRASAREPLAAMFYDRRYRVDQRQHAIRALRALASQALGHAIEERPRFGLLAPAAPELALPEAAIVLLHMTAREDKQWHEVHWRALARRLDAEGLPVVVPWGSPLEQARAHRIATGLAHAAVPPRLTLTQCAALLARARAVVGLDTGLTHLAAAFERPLVFMVPDTPRWPRYRAEPYWLERLESFGRGGRMPEVDEVWAGLERLGALA